MAYHVELTSTYAGKANYSWVLRYLIDSPTVDYRSKAYNRQLVRAAKKAIGWTGLRCDTDSNGDNITLRPRKACWIVFITPYENCMIDHFRGEDLRTKTEEPETV